ncbi:MAG: MAPEG family protein [Pseudomonadota bacterium]
MNDRGAVFLWGVPVIALTLAAIYVAPTLALPDGWGADRVRLGAVCAAAIGAWLLFAVLQVSTHRLFSAGDAPGPALSEPTPALRPKLAFLQNTLEQAVLAAIAYLAFAVTARDIQLALLPLDVGLFWLGRACFLFGHAKGMRGRAFGFALTFAPTLALYVILAAKLLAL